MREVFTTVLDIHTSGHANADTIKTVIETVRPREGIVGIHKSPTASLTMLDLSEELMGRIIPENHLSSEVTIIKKLI